MGAVRLGFALPFFSFAVAGRGSPPGGCGSGGGARNSPPDSPAPPSTSIRSFAQRPPPGTGPGNLSTAGRCGLRIPPALSSPRRESRGRRPRGISAKPLSLSPFFQHPETARTHDASLGPDPHRESKTTRRPPAATFTQARVAFASEVEMPKPPKRPRKALNISLQNFPRGGL